MKIDDFLSIGENSPLLSAVGLLVAIILFEGGLTLKFKELKVSGLPILRLCTVTVIISLVLTTVFMMYRAGLRLAALPPSSAVFSPSPARPSSRRSFGM